jgi:2-dehydro-3-deoxyphosphogluconate aldolase/(4S)-4-hydroxy-2-oxoglutarate aldolase
MSSGKVYARLSEVFALAPVIPVITIEDAAAAVPLARALVAGGLRVVEITLRTDAAVDAARAIVALSTGGCGRCRDRADVRRP